MKISDIIYSEISKFRRENTFMKPPLMDGGGGVLVSKEPKRIYLGFEQLKQIQSDPEYYNYANIKYDGSKKTVFDLEIFEVAETDHIFIA